MSLNRKRSVLLGVGLAVILALVVTISVVFTQKENTPRQEVGGVGVTRPTPTQPTQTVLESDVGGDRSKDGPSKQATGVVPTTKGDGSNLAVVPVLAKPTEGNKQTTGGGSCVAANAEELSKAVEEGTCELIMLTGTTEDAYILDDQIVVSRPVTIQGDPLVLPQIDASETLRCFLIKAGGRLELRAVRIVGGHGVFRNMVTNETIAEGTEANYPPGTLRREITGGSFYFEPDSLGGMFIGVVFVEEKNPLEGVEPVIRQMEYLVSERVYGGHVFMAGGVVDFIGCLFYDFEILTSFYDRWIFGGDILLLEGSVTFTGCTWFMVTIFGTENGVGMNGLVLGGSITVTMCDFNDFDLAVSLNGLGQTYTVGAGYLAITGVAFNFFNAMEQFSGAGDFTVLFGAMILTGVSLLDVYGLGVAAGAGLDYVVGGGLMIATGSVINQFNGPFWDSMAGGLVFLGGGASYFTASPVIGYESIGQDVGAGSLLFNSGGDLVWNWSPVISAFGAYASCAVGEYFYLGGGNTVIIGSPSITFGGMDFFTGQGNTLWQGGGGATLGWSPVYGAVALLEAQSPDWWIVGTCEPKNQEWAPQSPFYVWGGQGCIYYSDNAAWKGRRTQADAAPLAVAPRSKRRYMTATAVPIQAMLDAVPDMGLLSWQSERRRLEVNDSRLEHLVPADALPMARKMLVKTAELRAAMQKPDKEKQMPDGGIMHIEHAPAAGCQVCGVGSVVGPGASECNVDKTCDGFKPPQEAQELYKLDPNAERQDFHDQFVVTTALEPTTGANVTQLSPHDLRDAVVKALEEKVHLSDAVKVTVYSTETDPLFTHVMPPKARSLYATPTHDNTHHFKAVMVANSPEDAEALMQAIQASEGNYDEAATGSVGALAEGIRVALMHDMNISVGHVGLMYGDTLRIPAYKSKRLLHARPLLSHGAYSVFLSDPEQPAAHVTHVDHLTNYNLLLDRFPAHSKLSLHLVALDAGGARSARHLGMVLTDAQGKAQLAHRFEDADHTPTGEYYLKASDISSGAAGYSPAYSIERGKARQRQLYGPSLLV